MDDSPTAPGEPGSGARPDVHPDDDGWLGTFHRGPAVFSVFREVATDHR